MKQQLTEALSRLESEIELHRDDDYNPGFVAWLEDQSFICAAARLVEGLLPGEESVSVPCPETWDPNISCTVNHFEMRRVWDEGMLDHIMEAASFRSRDTVIAVLSALVELLTEKVET